MVVAVGPSHVAPSPYVCTRGYMQPSDESRACAAGAQSAGRTDVDLICALGAACAGNFSLESQLTALFGRHVSIPVAHAGVSDHTPALDSGKADKLTQSIAHGLESAKFADQKPYLFKKRHVNGGRGSCGSGGKKGNSKGRKKKGCLPPCAPSAPPNWRAAMSKVLQDNAVADFLLSFARPLGDAVDDLEAAIYAVRDKVAAGPPPHAHGGLHAHGDDQPGSESGGNAAAVRRHARGAGVGEAGTGGHACRAPAAADASTECIPTAGRNAHAAGGPGLKLLHDGQTTAGLVPRAQVRLCGGVLGTIGMVDRRDLEAQMAEGGGHALCYADIDETSRPAADDLKRMDVEIAQSMHVMQHPQLLLTRGRPGQAADAFGATLAMMASSASGGEIEAGSAMQEQRDCAVRRADEDASCSHR